ncbi:MAG TPA: ABC transporter permease [Opitutaceae bacterium]|jgi:ABC-2 type transport system permease protein|nr:ABC transporter permease [Opitutaceae bacterium]
MLLAILALLRKDFAHFRRDRASMILTFVVPFTMIYLFGQINGLGVGRGTGPGRTAAASQVVGGWAMQFLLFALVWSANSLFVERDLGIFLRILSGPVSRAAILWSKFLYGIFLGMLQLLTLFVAGQLLFHVALLAHLPLLALSCLAAAAACSAFGMLLAALSPSVEVARGLSTFCILLMSALGGAWFPVRFMPGFMQQLSRLTLVFWSADGFRLAMGQAATLAGQLPSLEVLGGMTAIFLAIAWLRFDRGTIFS